MRVHVLLYDSGEESEGIHSLEISGTTIVLMFESSDDAERYSGLLEAQDFPIPSVESLDREEIEAFCREAGYEFRFIESGFIPENDEERIFLAPPEANLDVDHWRDEEVIPDSNDPNENKKINQLDDIRKKLEGLL